MMKKIILILLILSTLCACGKITVDNIDWEDKVSSKASSDVFFHYYSSYDIKGAYADVTNVKKSAKSDTYYEVYGTVVCTDNYGEQYYAKWSGYATIDIVEAQKIIDEGAKKEDSFREAIKFTLVEKGTPTKGK